MFIHEIKNIVVGEDVVNGLAIKSSLNDKGNAFKTYAPAKKGDKIGLIFATKEDDELKIEYKEEYTVVFNEDPEKKAENVKLFAYQGTADISGAIIKGLFIKPVEGIGGCTALRNGENLVVIKEEVDGAELEAPEIEVTKAIIIDCKPYYGDVELEGSDPRPATDFQSGLIMGGPSERGTVVTGTLKYTSWPGQFSDDYHWFAVMQFNPVEGTQVNYRALQDDGVYILGFTADGGRRMIVTNDEGYERYYTFENCTFEPAPEEENKEDEKEDEEEH